MQTAYRLQDTIKQINIYTMDYKEREFEKEKVTNGQLRKKLLRTQRS